MRPHPLRLLRAGARVVEANVRRLPRPLKINLCVTYWCQYKCQTCNIWQRKPKDELTTDELLQFVAANAGTEWFDVTGGEIFLRPDIGDVLEAVLRSWHRLVVLHFPTNGFLTDRIVATTERLARLGRTPIVVTVSVDGDRTLNDEIRGIAGGFDRQMATFQALRRVPGVRAVLGMTLSRLNAGRVREVFEACRQACGTLSPNEFHLNVAQTSSHYYGTGPDATFTPSPDRIRQALEEYEALGRSWGVAAAVERRYLARMRRFVETGTTPMPCHALRSSCFVDPWGTVYPCISYGTPVGSLREHAFDLGAIWAGETARRLQAEIWRGECPQCWTACEAYQSILGNALAPWRRTTDPVVRTPATAEGAPGPRSS